MKQRQNCKPIVVNRTDLESNGDYMTAQKVKDECNNCLHQTLCVQITYELLGHKHDKAMDILNTIY